MHLDNEPNQWAVSAQTSIVGYLLSALPFAHHVLNDYAPVAVAHDAFLFVNVNAVRVLFI